MRRRTFIALVGGAAEWWPLSARAQQSSAVKRIGWLNTTAEDDRVLDSYYAAFPRELERLGWTSGRNLQIDARYGRGEVDRLRASALELLATAPQVVLVNSTLATTVLH